MWPSVSISFACFACLSLYCFLCVAEAEAEEGDEPLVPAGVLACWFLCDFPGLLLPSDFAPACRTFTPRIICILMYKYT